MSEFELPKTLTEKQRIADLVQETMDSLKGRSCYEPEILEAVKAVVYKEKETVSKTDFASALVSKLKEDGVVKHEGELSSIQKGVESALSRINEKRKVVSSKPE